MVTKLKPYNPSASELVADWHVLDARGKVLGRIASEAATLLMGKHRPGYVPHLLSGDFVIIVNAADVTVTGNKADQIVYTRHSQKPGKLKELPFRRVQAKFPERVIEHAVRGMLPKNKLGERMIRRLKVYAGEEHPHASQVTWTASRPERDAAAAAEAEEASRKRAEARQRNAARREIAAEAAVKTVGAENLTEKPEIAEGAVEATGKKGPARKPAARRTKAEASAARSGGSAATTRKRASSSTSKSSAAKPSASKSKSAATKPAGSSKASGPAKRTTRKKPANAKGDD